MKCFGFGATKDAEKICSGDLFAASFINGDALIDSLAICMAYGHKFAVIASFHRWFAKIMDALVIDCNSFILRSAIPLV
jgi:hypothetical protein